MGTHTETTQTETKEFDLRVTTKKPEFLGKETYVKVERTPDGNGIIESTTAEKESDGTNNLHYNVQGSVLVDAPAPYKGAIRLLWLT